MTENQTTSASNARQARNAFRFSLVMAVSMSIISAILLITFGMPKGFLDLTVIAILVAIISWVSTWLSYQKQHIIGILLLIAALFLACIVTSFTFSGFGPVLAMTTLIISFGAGSVALPRKYATRVNFVSVGLAIGFIVLDILEPFTRQPNDDSTLTWIIASILALIFGIGILRNFSNYNFRTKLIISFISVAALSIAVLTVFTQNTTSNLLTDNLERELQAIAISRSTRIGDIFNEQINSLNILALNEVIQSSIKEQIVAYPNDAEAVQAAIEERDQLWRTADAADNDNFPLVAEHLSNPTAQEIQKFQFALATHAEVFVTDRYGALVGTSNRTSDYYQADEGWWQAAYNDGSGAVYISNPEFDESVGQLSILIAIPIFDIDRGDIIGVLRTTYIVGALAEILQAPIGETGEADLYIPGELPLRIHAGESETVDLELYSQLVEVFDEPYIEMVYEGEESVVSQALVKSLEGNPAIEELGWFVTVHQDKQEVLAPIQTQTRAALGLVVIIVGVAAAAAVGLAQVLVRPITRLTDTAEEISAGDLEIRAEVITRDEIGALATTFNDMTDRLRRTLAGLEERVAARTQDLELAADVGRRLSLVRETDVMLTEAVEVIRERFDLYYTQVYLIDPTGRSLVLRAGTGDVGQTLLNRNHRLPIDMGSLNGIATTERRAVVVENTETSSLHRANPLLPDTRSEMVVPLLVGDQVIGVLDMQSSQPGALNPENLAAFEALAGSLAIAISNAGLFEEAEQARITVQEQVRRQTSEGWREFLDAIERSERLGYTYDRENITLSPDPLPEASDETTLVTPIRVAGASVGQLQFLRDEAWTEDDFAISNAVAQQVAQQIENLRLLAQAEQYQAEAQEALRRLTREGWEGYQDQFTAEPGFVYQDHEVKPLTESDDTFDEALTYEIKVREAAIGVLSIGGVEALSDDDAELIAAVNEQLSTHLENMRLSTQTEQALAETEKLYQSSDQIVKAETLQDVLFVLKNTTRLAELDRTALLRFDDYDATGKPNTCVIAAQITKEGIPTDFPDGTRLNYDDMGVVQHMNTDEALIIQNARFDERVSEYDLRIFEEAGIVGTIALPLVVGNQWIGFISANDSNPLEWAEEEVRQIMALAGQAASVIQAKILFERAQSRAQREQALRQITAAVRGSTDPATIMRTAVRELGTTLGRRTQIRFEQFDPSVDENNGNS